MVSDSLSRKGGHPTRDDANSANRRRGAERGFYCPGSAYSSS